MQNCDLPAELCIKPLCLVGISGLDTLNNAIHKSIWETFSNNRRPERSPVLFKLIENDHEFPVVKPKRTSYDWYIPKGIIKRNWMNKHLHEIPAVIVIFYDLDWNDTLWNEKMIECASRVQSLRAALEGRNTRIAVVLIQNTLPLPSGEDVVGSERAVSLCASCELNATSLFVLPHGDHLQGYVIRLESAFYEFAQNYYHTELKNVRGHKEHLNKNTHQYLLVRHQYKMGFLYELKQDIHTAHKHYSYAYNSLLEIRIVDTNALEIRTIAGFLNYKLCRLMFALNLPRDAISQFKAHIERFKERVGFQELAFEHFAWLSKQFSVFGDIFDEAVKLGLPAVQTQHPGVYYQQAAQYGIMRKETALELCANVVGYPHPDPLDGVSSLEFYGQRPWRPGKVSSEPPDPHLESNGIQALQYLEKQVQHSNTIVGLYGLAISQYKIYKCPRTRRFLILQMADEYYNSNEFGKALTLLTHMLSDFRSEKWWFLLTDILDKAIKCAYLTANVQDYLVLSLEILGRCTILELNLKRKIHENIHRILKRQIPFSIQNFAPDLLQDAVIHWQPRLQSEPLNLTLDLSNIVSCIETKARFTKAKYEVDESVTIEVFIRCSSPLVLTFSKVSVAINTPSLNSEFGVDATGLPPKALEFHSGEIKRFVIEFIADPNDINCDIQIGGISLIMGAASEVLVEMKFNPQTEQRIPVELLHFKQCPDKVDFDNIPPLLTALVVPRHSKLEVGLDYAIPALVGEWFMIKISIINEEEYEIQDLQVEINLAKDEIISLTEFSMGPNGVPDQLPLRLKTRPKLQPHDKLETEFYLRSHKVIENIVEMKISYILCSDAPVLSAKLQTLIVPVVKPFEISTKFLSRLMEEISQFYVGEEIGVMPKLRCLSPCPIIIENTSIEFVSPVKSIEANPVSRLANMALENKEVGVELFLGVSDKRLEENATIAHYTVKWRRESGLSTTSQMAIIGCPCEWIPLDLKLSLPAFALVRTPLLIKYELCNRSHQLLQLDVVMEGSEGFMYAGYKQYSISVLPESTKELKYNLYPLIPGNVALPRLSLSIPEGGEIPGFGQSQLRGLVERNLPTHLYVMPQVKGTPLVTDAVKPQKALA